MRTLLFAISLLGALSVVYVLFRGIFTMAQGSRGSAQSDRMMIARVALQGLTIVAVVLLFVVNSLTRG